MQKILNLGEVCWKAEDNPATRIEGMTFSAAPAQLTTISVPPSTALPPIADIASGLIEPDSGSVRFIDQAWPDMSPYQASQNRGMIGRIFPTHRWISNLSVMDNILLQQRHHSRRSEEILRAEAESLARQVGLSGIPTGRPEDVQAVDLRRLQWVRAFIGAPRLVLMEEPESGFSEHEQGPLIRLIETALTRGTAIVWITTEVAPAADIRRAGAQRFRMESGRLTVAAEAI